MPIVSLSGSRRRHRGPAGSVPHSPAPSRPWLGGRSAASKRQGGRSGERRTLTRKGNGPSTSVPRAVSSATPRPAPACPTARTTRRSRHSTRQPIGKEHISLSSSPRNRPEGGARRLRTSSARQGRPRAGWQGDLRVAWRQFLLSDGQALASSGSASTAWPFPVNTSPQSCNAVARQR